MSRIARLVSLLSGVNILFYSSHSSSYSDIIFQVRALCLSVEDSSVFVQRVALDILLAGFPLHQSQLTRADLVHVLTSAVKVIFQHDIT